MQLITTNQLFPTIYLTAADLQARTVTVIVESAEIRHVWSDKAQSMVPRIVLKFQGKTKLACLNKTQSIAMTTITDEENPQRWVGTTIQLTPTPSPNGKPTITITASP